MQSSAGSYPATFTFDAPERVANWRPLVHWLLAIPHWILLYLIGYASTLLALVSWVVILFTGKMPAGLAGIQMLYVRYYLRVQTYVYFLREEYPPFAFATDAADPGDDPRVRVDFTPQLEGRNRVTVFFRLLLVIPQMIVVALLFVGLVVVVLIGFFAVLFTGRWPAGLRDFTVGVWRWWMRVEAYLLLLTDEYPPFSLD